MCMIETRKLVKRFGNLVAVNGVDLKVNEGEIFGLLGPNGAGKTTIISILCCIMKPTSGEAYVNGYDVMKKPDKVRKAIGVVFQEPAVDEQLTGRQNMKIHAMLYNVPKASIKPRIDFALELVELGSRADTMVKTYSGGMRRRLEIARSLLHTPKILFLDEPTMGLDTQTRERIWEYIVELAKHSKMTIILTTHYMDEADRLCDRVAIIDSGEIKAEGTPKELKSRLGGDMITIKTKDHEKLAAKIKEFDFVKSVSETMDSVKIALENAEEHITTLTSAARDMGIPIQSIALHEPALSDVYLHYTGKQFREEKATGAMIARKMMAHMRRPAK
jgi:ABC-2 type transport system ATP-binding protein